MSKDSDDPNAGPGHRNRRVRPLEGDTGPAAATQDSKCTGSAHDSESGCTGSRGSRDYSGLAEEIIRLGKAHYEAIKHYRHLARRGGHDAVEADWKLVDGFPMAEISPATLIWVAIMKSQRKVAS